MLSDPVDPDSQRAKRGSISRPTTRVDRFLEQLGEPADSIRIERRIPELGATASLHGGHDQVIDPSAQRITRPVLAAQIDRAPDALQDHQSIHEAVPTRGREDWRASQLEAALRQSEQRTGEVAAVDRRNVTRLQGRETPRVVPVEQVSAVALEPPDGLEAIANPTAEIPEPDVSEIPGRKAR